jgi:hypothetical protein
MPEIHGLAAWSPSSGRIEVPTPQAGVLAVGRVQAQAGWHVLP